MLREFVGKLKNYFRQNLRGEQTHFNSLEYRVYNLDEFTTKTLPADCIDKKLIYFTNGQGQCTVFRSSMDQYYDQ